MTARREAPSRMEPRRRASTGGYCDESCDRVESTRESVAGASSNGRSGGGGPVGGGGRLDADKGRGASMPRRGGTTTVSSGAGYS
jgi:hypothetical protein